MPGGMATIHTENIANMKTSQNRYDALVVGGGMVARRRPRAGTGGLVGGVAGTSGAAGVRGAKPAGSAHFRYRLHFGGAAETARRAAGRDGDAHGAVSPAGDGNGRRRAWRSTRCPGLPELGFMVENRILQLALWQQFAQCANLTLLCPAAAIAAAGGQCGS